MKCFDLSDDNEQLIYDEFEETGLHNYVQLKVVGTAKSKELITVCTNAPVARWIGKIPDDTVNFVVYEEAFDRLDDETKKLVVRDALNAISYDTEKEKLSTRVPMLSVTAGGYAKYGEKLVKAQAIGVAAMLQIEEEKKAAKEAAKAEKASRQKRNN